MRSLSRAVAGSGATTNDPEEIVFYWCAVCMAKMWECTPQEAQARIIGERPGFAKKRAKNEAFKIADAKVAQALPALTKSDRRLIATRITVEDMQEVVAPLSKFIQLKCASLRLRSDCVDQHNVLLQKLKSASTIEEANELIPELERIEDLIDEHSAPLAFANKGKEQWSYCLAADYDDQWCITYDSKGNIVSALRVLHLCMSGHSEDPCLTAIEGKAWQRMMANPWASGQRWYCNVCQARYRPRMGVLCEIHIRGQVFWLRGTYPDELKDVKWLRVEEEMSPHVNTPAELYARIQNVQPYTGDGMLRAATPWEITVGGKDGVWRVQDKAGLMALPLWPFSDIISFSKK